MALLELSPKERWVRLAGRESTGWLKGSNYEKRDE